MKSSHRGKVLITDANSRKGLAAVRSLGQRGLHVIAGNDKPHALAFTSRFCAGRFLYPSPNEGPKEYLAFMLEHLRAERYDCFIPMSDEEVTLVARHREKFGELTNLVMVDGGTMEVAQDKWRTAEFALAQGFPHPKTFVVDHLDDLERLQNQVPYPAIIKPRKSSGARGLVFVERPEELVPQYLRVHRHFPFPLIQECIPTNSPKYAVSCLLNHQSQVRVAVVQRFWRQYPLKGGPATCFETVDRPDLQGYGVRILEILGWQGVAEVEFLEDERDGEVKLMEINPRFSATLALTIQAGVELPHLLYSLATEGDVEPHMDYRFGEVCRSMLPGEILYFLTSGRRWRMEPSFWRFRGPNLGYSVWSRNDVRPAFAHLRFALKSLFDREMRDVVFRRL